MPYEGGSITCGHPVEEEEDAHIDSAGNTITLKCPGPDGMHIHSQERAPCAAYMEEVCVHVSELVCVLPYVVSLKRIKRTTPCVEMCPP